MIVQKITFHNTTFGLSYSALVFRLVRDEKGVVLLVSLYMFENI